MTITSDRISPLVDEPDSDLLPGSSDVEWAEHAYRHRPQTPAPTPPRARVRRLERRPHRLRILATAFAVLLVMATLVVLLTTQGSQAPARQSTPVPTVATKPSAARPSAKPVLTPPLLKPSPFLYPEILTAPRR